MKIKIIFFLVFIIFSSCYESDDIKEISLSSDDKIIQTLNQFDSIPKLYFAVSSMVSPMETFNLYNDFINYISKKLGVKIEFKQRKTYSEVNELLQKNKFDFAFICTGAYLEAKNRIPIEILVVPVVNGRPYYQAYVIVHKDSNIDDLSDLINRSFAFTDPLSNTGYSYIVNWLKNNKTTPEKYFSKTIFTYAHDYSIQAVKRKIVDGATVNGLVYEYLKKFQPEKVEGIKIINKSRDFGIPPLVVQKNLNNDLKTRLKKIMLTMHLDKEGKELLNRIMIDKFIEADESLYK